MIDMDRRQSVIKAKTELSMDAVKYKVELDRVTAMLCGLLTDVEETDSVYLTEYLTVNPDLGVWWENHKRQDAQRKQDALEAAMTELKKISQTTGGIEAILLMEEHRVR